MMTALMVPLIGPARGKLERDRPPRRPICEKRRNRPRFRASPRNTRKKPEPRPFGANFVQKARSAPARPQRRPDRTKLGLLPGPGKDGRQVGCESTGQECAPSIRLLRDSLRAPTEWIAGAVLGLLLAAAGGMSGLLLWRRHRPLLRRRDDWRSGRLTEEGAILFEGAVPPCHLPPGAAIPPGPVVVVPLGAGRPATYRDAGSLGPIHVAPGTPEEYEERLHLTMAARFAFVLCALALTCTPLLSFWLLAR